MQLASAWIGRIRPSRIAHCGQHSYAVQSASNPALQVFNKHAKHAQRERAASNVEASREVDYIRDEIASRLSERLLVMDALCYLVPPERLQLIA